MCTTEHHCVTTKRRYRSGKWYGTNLLYHMVFYAIVSSNNIKT